MWIDGREWKLVPVEPTDEMRNAGWRTRHEGHPLAQIYRAMLAAGPTPPTAAQEKAAPSDDDLRLLWEETYFAEPETMLRIIRFARDLLSCYGQAPAASAEPVELVEAVTKAILFEDSGSTADWRDNTNLGQAAIRAYATAVRAAIAPHRAEQVALMQQADKDGRAFNAQGHSQAIQAIDVCLASLAAPVAAKDHPRFIAGYDAGMADARRMAARAEPVPVEIERLAINRYRPVPAGALAYKVVAGDGSRSLFSGTKDECQIVARKLTEAFLDGAHVAINAAPVAAQAQPSGDTGELPALDERTTFDQWFCRERALPMDADTTQYDEAFLAYRAWQARAALAVQASCQAPAASAEQVDMGVHCTGHVDYDPNSTIVPDAPVAAQAPLHPAIREGIEAAFEQREGWMEKIGAAVRHLSEHAQAPAADGDAPPAALDLDAAARTLAECMDYPWEPMPDQGRREMRKHAQRVLDAAMQRTTGSEK